MLIIIKIGNWGQNFAPHFPCHSNFNANWQHSKQRNHIINQNSAKLRHGQFAHSCMMIKETKDYLTMTKSAKSQVLQKMVTNKSSQNLHWKCMEILVTCIFHIQVSLEYFSTNWEWKGCKESYSRFLSEVYFRVGTIDEIFWIHLYSDSR